MEQRDKQEMTTADLADRRPAERGDRVPVDPDAPTMPILRSATAVAEPESGPEEHPFFASADREEMRAEWQQIQTGFVDDPRQAVQAADGLVAQAIQRLARVFADERGRLEGQWSRGGDVSTEDLRIALQRYRSFFDRLLSA
jgi:hypothetical protein